MLSRTFLSLAASLLGTSSLIASELLTSEDHGDLPAAEWAQTLGTDPAHQIDTFSTDGVSPKPRSRGAKFARPRPVWMPVRR